EADRFAIDQEFNWRSFRREFNRHRFRGWRLKYQLADLDRNVCEIRPVLSYVSSLFHQDDAMTTVDCAFGTRRSKSVVVGIDGVSVPLSANFADLPDRDVVMFAVKGSRKI